VGRLPENLNLSVNQVADFAHACQYRNKNGVAAEAAPRVISRDAGRFGFTLTLAEVKLELPQSMKSSPAMAAADPTQRLRGSGSRRSRNRSHHSSATPAMRYVQNTMGGMTFTPGESAFSDSVVVGAAASLTSAWF